VVVTPELAREMAGLSLELGRQVGLIIDRSGQVHHVLVGDHRSIFIPSLGQSRSRTSRLKGLRCLHTHLGGEGITEDDLMDLLFLRLDYMSVVEVKENGLPGKVASVHLLPEPKGTEQWAFLPPAEPGRLPKTLQGEISALEAEFARLRPAKEVEEHRDRAILVSVTTESRTRAQASMDELVELARSDDVLVLDTVIQRRDRIHPRYILGRGKLSEIMLKALRLNANLLIFDQELNPSQIRSITDHTELRVIDRTQLILDIFARRAQSREGKLQIEMAQLKYMLPRLGLRDDALSRLTGGIGGRGPGETRLEIDRRRINDRITRLARNLKAVSRERSLRRVRRRKRDLPVISLVGYTNAGKSTLLNTLTSSTITAEDKYFATLDPTSRRLRFPQDMEVIVTDTVGFIRRLPKDLLQAFKATLEELHEADLLVHVVDISNPDFSEQMRVVDTLLDEIDLGEIPRLVLFNKIDRVDPGFVSEQCRIHHAEAVSALDASTFAGFLHRARREIRKHWNQTRARAV